MISETNQNSDPQHTLFDMANNNLDEAMSKFLIVEIALTILTMRHTVPGEVGNCWTEVLLKYVIKANTIS